jgi:hypothetical protein
VIVTSVWDGGSPLRFVLYAVALLLAGLFLLMVVGLGAVVFLADRECGPAFGYYGCKAPTTATGNESR